MRNAVNWIIGNVKSSDHGNVRDLARVVSSCSCEFLRNLEQSREYIAEIGAKRIRDGMVVFTHCHSSTVTYLLKKAKEQGKTFEVICTETRPVFQGRITAKEMLDLGVKTTLIVDSAARSFMRKADIVIVGADAHNVRGRRCQQNRHGNHRRPCPRSPSAILWAPRTRQAGRSAPREDTRSRPSRPPVRVGRPRPGPPASVRRSRRSARRRGRPRAAAGLGRAHDGPSRTAGAAAATSSGSTSRFVPWRDRDRPLRVRAGPSGTGTPRIVVSSWIPPESVTTTAAPRTSDRKSM